MDITLKPEQEQFIREKLQSGKYQTTDEVIIEAFRLLEERDRRYAQWLQETSEKIAIGLNELERGKGVKLEVAMTEIRDMISEARENNP
jgi:antitoxin ParD1/3/4